MTPASSGAAVRMTIGGVVELDVFGAPPTQLQRLQTHYGAVPSAADRQADVTIRYVDAIPSGPLTHLGLVSAAVSSEGFHIVDDLDQHPVATLPFGTLDGPCEVTYVTKSKDTPYLTDILRLALLRHSHIALQAAAFEYGREGVLVVAWPKSGKTGAVLGAMTQGARVLGDDWIAVAQNGQSMFALQPTLTISDWQLPQVRGAVDVSAPARFKIVRMFERAYRSRRFPHFELVDKAVPQLVRTLKVTVPVRDLGPTASAIKPSRIFLLNSAPAGSIRVSTRKPTDAAIRATLANRFEWSRFRNVYVAWQFAHDGATDSAMESLERREATAIEEAVSGLQVFQVEHTYPGPLEPLFTALARHC